MYWTVNDSGFFFPVIWMLGVGVAPPPFIHIQNMYSQGLDVSFLGFFPDLISPSIFAQLICSHLCLILRLQ